jgi:hypothetical protein
MSLASQQADSANTAQIVARHVEQMEVQLCTEEMQLGRGGGIDMGIGPGTIAYRCCHNGHWRMQQHRHRSTLSYSSFSILFFVKMS